MVAASPQATQNSLPSGSCMTMAYDSGPRVVEVLGVALVHRRPGVDRAPPPSQSTRSLRSSRPAPCGRHRPCTSMWSRFFDGLALRHDLEPDRGTATGRVEDPIDGVPHRPASSLSGTPDEQTGTKPRCHDGLRWRAPIRVAGHRPELDAARRPGREPEPASSAPRGGRRRHRRSTFSLAIDESDCHVDHTHITSVRSAVCRVAALRPEPSRTRLDRQRRASCATRTWRILSRRCRRVRSRGERYR